MRQMHHCILITILFLLSGRGMHDELSAQSIAEAGSADQYRISRLLYQDNFDRDTKNWVVETPASPYSAVGIEHGKLVIDVDQGATVWFSQKLTGNLLIEYHRKVLVDHGHNDRLSDLNQFWMATDPRQDTLFTRSGNFSEYDSLKLYYAGIGGNSNSTTRFRKYLGNGERTLLFDLQDKPHLLLPNKTYLIQLVVCRGCTRVFVDNELYFSFEDEEPLRDGYFGFRTVQSHQEIDDFKVYELK